MSAGPGVQYKFTQQGVSDLVDRIKQLHNEFRNGQITYKEYKTEVREATAQGRAATSQFNQMKGAIAASNPELLQFTRTMSMFGGVANTVLSVTNAINLATIAGNQYDQQVADTQVQLAEARRKAASDLVTYGEKSQQYQDDLQLEAALTNKLAYQEQQRARQSFTNAVTIVASAFSVLGAVSQTYIGFKALFASISPQMWENIGIAIAGIGTQIKALGTALSGLAFSVGIPIAIFVGAFYGAYELIRALNPKYAESMTELEGIIKNNWHVDGLTAFLVAPFVGAYLGFAKLEDQITEDLYNFVNAFINGLNMIPNAINSMNIPGLHLGTIQNLLPPGFANGGQDSFYNQAIRDLNINKGNAGGSTGSSLGGLLPSAYGDSAVPNAINLATIVGNQHDQQVADIQVKLAEARRQAASDLATYGEKSQQHQDDLQKEQALTDTSANTKDVFQYLSGQVGPILNSGNTVASQQNQNLISINNNLLAGNQLAQNALQAQTDQKTSTVAAIKILQDQIAQLSTQPQSEMNSFHSDPDTGQPVDFRSVPTAAARQLAQAKQALITLQSREVGTSSDILGSYLQSAGLSPTTGVGSVVMSALGQGTSGLTAADIQEFIQTHDYGVFTRATLRNDTGQMIIDPVTGVVRPATADEEQNNPAIRAQLLARAQSKDGIINIAPIDPYSVTPAGMKWITNANGVRTLTRAAVGFEGLVSSPHMFLAGESGPEHVSISPVGKSDSSGGSSITIIVQGSLLRENDLAGIIRNVMKSDYRRVLS